MHLYDIIDKFFLEADGDGGFCQGNFPRVSGSHPYYLSLTHGAFFEKSKIMLDKKDGWKY